MDVGGSNPSLGAERRKKMSDSFVNRLATMDVNESVDYVGDHTNKLNEILKSLEPKQFSVSINVKRHKIIRIK